MLAIMPSHSPKDEKTPLDDDEEKQLVKIITDADSQPSLPHQNGTLFPAPVAAIISAGTGIGAFSVRAGTRIAGWGLYAGREGTLKTLSLSRSAAETVLYLAGRDLASRSTSELSHQDAVNLLGRGLDLLNLAISTASFAASSGFYTTELILRSVAGTTEKTLSMLNAVFGSTESSKAVASVIRLLTNELNKPEAGEVLKYREILGAVVSFVLLQRWGRRKTQLEFRNAGGEETIWDAVIDDRGFRADVVGTRRQQTVTLNSGVAAPAMTFSCPDGDGDEDFEALERGTLFGGAQAVLTDDDQLTLSDDEIYLRIASQLPDEAIVNITTETIQAKTIRVEIRHEEAAHVEAPPGTIMVAERLNHDQPGESDGPSQTIIFRTALKRTNSAEIGPNKQLQLTPADEPADLDNEEGLVMRSSKATESVASSASKGKGMSDESDPEHFDRDGAGLSQSSLGPMANQKKSRKPVFGNSASASSKLPLAKSPPKEKAAKIAKQDTGKRIRKALKTLSPSSSVTAMKDAQNSFPRRRNDAGKPLPSIPRFTPASESSLVTPPRIYPIPSLSNGHSPISSPVTAHSPQQTTSSSYFSVQRSRRDSAVSQTDTYSVRSESRPGSPTFTRTHTRTVSGIPKTKSDIGLSAHETDSRLEPSSNSVHHQRTRSFVPSLYSMGSKHSGEAVVLQLRKPATRKSIYEDSKMIDTLMAEGKVPGIFPDRHLAKTVRRFARFATASYGSSFLRIMGLTSEGRPPGDSKEVTALDVQHHEHASFSTHTGLPADTILLSSFYDPQGVTGNAEWSASAISPLIHFISIDHESKAVVLTCRGTLGFEDILTDMTCDYDDIFWQGISYKVHRGIHASARRLLGGIGSRVMATIKASLEEYDDYGLVLCGHSLGGAVAALVAILISEPTHNLSGQAFVTGAPPKLLTGASPALNKTHPPPIALPSGRPIHVYAYGTPATVSEPLRVATRGLITTVVNASDIVPSLSLGTLHDFRTVALHLKGDTSDAYHMMMTRIWRRVRSFLQFDTDAMQNGPPLPEDLAGDGIGEDQWAWKLLQQLRDSMTNFKLVPPGEVFILETSRVFDRLGPDVKQEATFGADINDDNKTEKVYRALGRPATRVQFKWVRDVPGRFSELKFGRDMFGDHNPGRYESGLGALEGGVCDE